jgi:YD repeat-containing protein
MKNVTAHSVTSNKSRSFKYFLCFLFIGLITFLISCSDDDEATPAPAVIPPPSVCKVKSQTTSGSGTESATVTYTYNFAFNHTYDPAGNMLSSNSTYNYNYSDGKTAASTISEKNVFDENGFILNKTSQYSSTGKDGTASNSSNEHVYTYEKDRLTKESVNSIRDGKTKDYSFSYEYDIDGKLTKFTSTYDNSYIKFEWNGNILQKMTRVDQVGNTNTPFLEYNQAGLLVKSIETRGSTTDEYRYQYDADGQEIRFERYINAKPSSAYTTEYDNKDNPFKQLYGKFKGHPTLPDTRSEYSPKRNITKSVYYTANITTGEWEVSNTTLYTNDYNGKNLPVEVVSKTLDKTGKQTNTHRISYVYQDCQ